MKEKMFEIWMWTMAITFSIAAFVTAVAWVAFLFLQIVGWCNG